MVKIKYNLALIAVVLLVTVPCYAEWAVNFGSNYSDTAKSIQQTQDGGYVVAGQGGASGGYLIAKFNSDGTVAWQKEYNLDASEPFDIAQSIEQTQDGGYIVAGTSSSGYNPKIWILKLNAEGASEWQKQTIYENNPGFRASASSVKETFDQAGPERNPNGYIVTGETMHLTTGTRDIWVLKLHLDGTIDWQKTYSDVTDVSYSIEQTFDQAGNPDGYIVACSTTDNFIFSDARLLRLNLDGTINWERVYGGSPIYAYSVHQIRDGGFIVAGTGSTNVPDLPIGRHFWVAELNVDGMVEWQKIYSSLSGEDVLFSMEEVIDSSGESNGYVVAGLTSIDVDQNDVDQNDVWVLKLDLNGSIEWEKTYGGSLNESAYSIQQTFDQVGNPNGYAVAGSTSSFGTARDAFVLKLNTNGEIPDCDIMGTSEATVTDGTLWFYDPPPTVIVEDSSAGLLDTNIAPIELVYSTELICYSEPAVIDSDSDGLPDDLEISTGTDPSDDDTDDDGLLDGPGSGEDVNANGIVDPGETDPRNTDTDEDNIQDGTEGGLMEPEGNNTDMNVFIPDADSTTTTNPTDADSDEDGIIDGNEDKDANGAIEPSLGESDPNNPDSDGDGIYDGTEVGLTEPQNPDATELSAESFVPDADPTTTTDPTNSDTDDDGLSDGEEDVNKNGAYEPDEGETDPNDSGTGNGQCYILGNDPKPSILDQDIFVFEGNANEEVTIRLEESEGDNTGERATLILKDRIRRVWFFDIDRSALPNEITATLPATGKYVIVVTEQPMFISHNRFRGNYCLTLEASPETAQTLEPTHWVE